MRIGIKGWPFASSHSSAIPVTRRQAPQHQDHLRSTEGMRLSRRFVLPQLRYCKQSRGFLSSQGCNRRSTGCLMHRSRCSSAPWGCCWGCIDGGTRQPPRTRWSLPCDVGILPNSTLAATEQWVGELLATVADRCMVSLDRYCDEYVNGSGLWHLEDDQHLLKKPAAAAQVIHGSRHVELVVLNSGAFLRSLLHSWRSRGRGSVGSLWALGAWSY